MDPEPRELGDALSSARHIWVARAAAPIEERTPSTPFEGGSLCAAGKCEAMGCFGRWCCSRTAWVDLEGRLAQRNEGSASMPWADFLPASIDVQLQYCLTAVRWPISSTKGHPAHAQSSRRSSKPVVGHDRPRRRLVGRLEQASRSCREGDDQNASVAFRRAVRQHGVVVSLMCCAGFRRSYNVS